MRREVEVEADGTRQTSIREGESAAAIAASAIRSWRFDAELVSSQSGTDLYGDYQSFAFQAGRLWATVRVRPGRAG